MRRGYAPRDQSRLPREHSLGALASDPRWLYLAEFYLPAGSTLATIAQRACAGAEQAATNGHTIAFEEAFLTLDESCFLLYRARRAADVTAAGTLAGLAFDQVTDAVVRRQTGL